MVHAWARPLPYTSGGTVEMYIIMQAPEVYRPAMIWCSFSYIFIILLLVGCHHEYDFTTTMYNTLSHFIYAHTFNLIAI